MIKPCPLLKSLTDQLMEEVRAYGILEVSTEQYQIICNSIIKFGEARQVVSYSPAFIDSYRGRSRQEIRFGRDMQGVPKIPTQGGTYVIFDCRIRQSGLFKRQTSVA